MSGTPTLREILERHVAWGNIIYDSEGAIEVAILAWSRAREKRYGERVREACALLCETEWVTGGGEPYPQQVQSEEAVRIREMRMPEPEPEAQ